MPPVETVNLHSFAVFWRNTGVVDRYDRPVYGEPEEIAVNWKYNRRSGDKGKGGTSPITATVIVAESIPIKSRLWLGELADWYGSSGSGGQDDEVMIVDSFEYCEDVRGREALYSLQLSRAMDQSPIGGN